MSPLTLNERQREAIRLVHRALDILTVEQLPERKPPGTEPAPQAGPQLVKECA